MLNQFVMTWQTEVEGWECVHVKWVADSWRCLNGAERGGATGVRRVW